MSDKVPQKPSSKKKPAMTLKEKRTAKKQKNENKKPLI